MIDFLAPAEIYLRTLLDNLMYQGHKCRPIPEEQKGLVASLPGTISRLSGFRIEIVSLLQGR